MASNKFFLLILTFFSFNAQGSPLLQSIFNKDNPIIDGIANEQLWNNAPSLITHDPIANIDIQLQSVYSTDKISFLVKFADANANKEHKIMYWNQQKQRYITGIEREDTFIFKWSMLPVYMDLSLSSNTPYKADIWYWKSFRTNHQGYADDKIQLYHTKRKKHAQLLISKEGAPFYLSRQGDKGKAAYRTYILLEKTAQKRNKYQQVTPSGSRADIKAKGVWKSGLWTIEWQRALNTTHNDDVQFDISNHYYFGVSRFEIAGRKIDPSLQEPNFGAGEINETIQFEFIKP